LQGKEITLQGATTVAGDDENSFTTVHSNSNGNTINSLPSSTLFVADASKLPPAPGRVYVETSDSHGTGSKDLMVLAYTGRDTTLNKLTGCGPVTGFLTYPLTGTVSTGYYVIGIIADDKTVIFDHITGGGHLLSSKPSSGNNLLRITGITFAADPGFTSSTNYTLLFAGYSEKFRMDHCHFHNIFGSTLLTNGKAGVMDHCVNYMGISNTSKFWECNFHYWRNGSNQPDLGHNVFHDDSLYGSKYTMYLESSLHYCCKNMISGIPDTEMGGRAAIRHSILINDTSRGHGTEASNNRGARLREIYKNTHLRTIKDNTGTACLLRGGVSLHWGNTYDTGFDVNGKCLNLQTYRASEQPGHPNGNPVVYLGNGASTGQWGGGDGRSPWDINATEADGSHVPGHADHGRFWNGTVTSSFPTGSNVTLSTSVTVSGANVTTNQYQYYQIINTTPGSNHINGHTEIESHTASVGGTFTMVLTHGAGRGSNNGIPDAPLPVFTAGDTIEIWKPVIYVDQGGRGKTDLPNWAAPTWMNNQLEPVYGWLNRRANANYLVGTTTPVTSLPNRDYYNEVAGGQQVSPTSPFNGTSGIGWGTLANRPITGTNGNDPSGSTTNPPGVAYWATNTPSVNGSTDDGALYVWRGGAWTLYYQPYTYPHPLSGVAIPLITSNSSASFTEGVGGTFQATSTNFSAAPIWTRVGGTFPASGTTLSNGGLLTVGAGSAAGVYTFTLTATNGGEVDTQSFTLIVTATPTRVIALSGSLAFGDVDINTTSQKSLTITNNGNVILTVTDITLPTGFVASETSFTVAPLASHLVSITFSPIIAGTYSGTATIVSDKTSGTNTAAVSGFSVTRIVGTTGSLDFGSITVGQTATRQLTISNSGNRTLSITSIAYPQGFSGDLLSASIAVGANKILNVTFAPLAAQSYSGLVDILSNKTSGTSSVATSGTGTASATKIVQLTGSLAFGSILDGTTLTKVLTITNSGNALLTVTDLTLPTGYGADWTAGTIAAGAHQDVNITFSPVAVTTYNGTATVVSDATGGTNTAAVTGAGVAPTTKIIGLSGSLDFGNVAVNATSTRTLTITNTGSVILTVSSITYPTGYTGAFAGTIAPGASQDVTVTFAPTLAQSYPGTITVNSDKTSGTNTIAPSGVGVAPATKVISLSGDLSYSNVQKNHTKQKILTISNLGTTLLTVTNITLPTGFTANISSFSIAPGASQDVTITFRPTAQQTYSGTITVVSDATSGLNTIACTGNGTNKRQVPFFLIVG